MSDVTGMVTLAALAGDLRAAGLAGGLSAGQVHGDGVLYGPFAQAQSYTVSAHGDIHVHLPDDADVRLSVRTTGRVRSDVPLTPASDGTSAFSATVGQGASQIMVNGRGDLRITRAGAAEASPHPGRTAHDPGPTHPRPI